MATTQEKVLTFEETLKAAGITGDALKAAIAAHEANKQVTVIQAGKRSQADVEQIKRRVLYVQLKQAILRVHFSEVDRELHPASDHAIDKANLAGKRVGELQRACGLSNEQVAELDKQLRTASYKPVAAAASK
jgi:hypothetical protein